jgi:hypothetical protein
MDTKHDTRSLTVVFRDGRQRTYRRGTRGQSYRTEGSAEGCEAGRNDCPVCDISPRGDRRGETYNPTGFCVGVYGGCRSAYVRAGLYLAAIWPDLAPRAGAPAGRGGGADGLG